MPMKPNSTKILVESSNVRYLDEFIEADFAYESCQCEKDEATSVIRVVPTKTLVTFKTGRKVPKTGLMLVGWGGNNGTTVTGAILANKHRMKWMTKSGLQEANYFGSITQSSTVLLGKDSNGQDLFVPMNDLLPMVNPNDIVVDGWDISGLNMCEAMRRAQVLDVNLQELLKPYMQEMKPRKAIYNPDFIASNQMDRADNLISEKDKWAQVGHIRQDIRDFKAKHKLDTVIVLWTANTERYTNVMPGVHDTADNLLEAIKANHDEIAPSTLYAVSAVLEECTYINGSPQNTFVPGLIELAESKNVFISGDDFKSGQTKLKSVLVDFLVNAGIKPCSIASYNHLGNNDGKNLSAPQQFRSKEISKSNVVDDMVHSNQILFGKEPRRPDHCVVIKYVPYVGDSKRAMDEYVSELMLGGHNTIIIHNTCEDSLLASPLILDLAILAELCQRVEFKIHNPKGNAEYQKFNSVLSVLSYLCKAPLVERGANVVNSLFRQRTTIENLLRALLSLPPLNHLDLQSKCSQRSLWYQEKVESIFIRKPQQQKFTANPLNERSINGIDRTIKGF